MNNDMILTNDFRGFRCAFTGHRRLPADFDVSALDAAIRQLLREGYTTFYCGMALGFDMLAFSRLLEVKETYPVFVEAFVPTTSQSKGYPPEQKELYDRLIAQADAVYTISPEYYAGVEIVRNKRMVEKADIVLAYLRKSTGGTAFTVGYAKERGIEVRYL